METIKKIPFNLVTIPIILLLFFLLFKIVTFSNIFNGIIGSPQTIEPWKVLIIFFGAAFMSVSADKSGLFEHISSKVLSKANGRGILLFALTFFFSWFLAIFTSNDVVILTVTPIVFYFSLYSNLNVIPLLFACLIGANNGIFLMTDNPADIVLATSLGIDQVSFIQGTFLPSLVALVVSFLLLYFYFRKEITEKYIQKNMIKPVHSWFDAKSSLYLLIAFIIAMIVSGYIHIQIWVIVLFFIILFVIKDITIAYIQPHKLFESAHGKLWRLRQSFLSIPWDILPFLIVMFTLINVLSHWGLFDSLGSYITNNIHTKLQASFSFGFAGLIFANIINNHPSSLLLASLFKNSFFNLAPDLLRTGALAVILSTAIGGSLTFVGSLGAFMWKKILGDRGIKISYIQFAKVGLCVIPLAMLCALVVLAIMKN